MSGSENSNNNIRKMSRIALKNAKRRAKRREKKKKEIDNVAIVEKEHVETRTKKEKPDVNVIYVSSNDVEDVKKLAEENADYSELLEVFEKFQSVEELLNGPIEVINFLNSSS